MNYQLGEDIIFKIADNSNLTLRVVSTSPLALDYVKRFEVIGIYPNIKIKKMSKPKDIKQIIREATRGLS